MKTAVRGVGASLGFTLWGLLILAVVVAGVFAINSVVYPWWLSIQREAVESSKSYNDSRNTMLYTYMSEYEDLSVKVAESSDNPAAVQAYQGQQQAIIDSMCQMKGTMNSGTVSPDVNSFLSQHGGC